VINESINNAGVGTDKVATTITSKVITLNIAATIIYLSLLISATSLKLSANQLLLNASESNTNLNISSYEVDYPVIPVATNVWLYGDGSTILYGDGQEVTYGLTT